MATFSSDGFLPSTSEYTKRKADVKVATPDIILQDNIISSDTITDAFFAEIGGTEILASARSVTIDSPLHEGSSLVVDSGAGLQIDSKTETSISEDLYTEVNVTRYFPIDSTVLAKYIDKSFDEPTDPSFSDASKETKSTFPGYIEIYLNSLPNRYQIEVEVINDATAEDAILYVGEG